MPTTLGGITRKDFKMENNKKKIPASIKVAGVMSNFMKKKMEQEIKEELASVGKEELWKMIEQYAKLTTAANFYELITE
jgi:hypothetical protein